MSQGKGKEVISHAINSMIDYTRTHFKDEEAFLQMHNYPELNAQQKAHAEFVDKVLNFKKQYEAGTLTTTIELFGFLNKWLVEHIKKSDTKYGQALANKV
jgi:hemerythrin-like metal-binding protein